MNFLCSCCKQRVTKDERKEKPVGRADSRFPTAGFRGAYQNCRCYGAVRAYCTVWLLSHFAPIRVWRTLESGSGTAGGLCPLDKMGMTRYNRGVPVLTKYRSRRYENTAVIRLR